MSVKITQFEAENVKRIRAAALTPDENGLTIIGGRNNQGKTSVLDALIWTLGGERFRPSQAQQEGSVVPPHTRVKLSNGIVAERSGENGNLKVTDETGRRAGQQLLNTFVEQLALDMPKFMSSTSREKAEILLQLIGLEDQVAELERKEKELYDKRRAVGQIADQKQKYAQELPSYPDAPAELVSAYDLIQRQQDILARNGENLRKRERASLLEAQRTALRRELDELQEKYDRVCQDCDIAQRDALDLVDEATDELEESIRNVEAINIKVRTNQDKLRAETEAQTYRDQYDGLSRGLEETRRQKQELLEGAKLPLPGLSVEDGELTYQGKNWDCMSGSDQLKVSTAIVRALKPQCGFVLVDKLEQMDLQTLREFGDWAEQEGLQIISTRVSTGDECAIIIEDGCAVEPSRAEQSGDDVTNKAVAWGEDF